MKDLKEPAVTQNTVAYFTAILKAAEANGLGISVELNEETFTREYVVTRASPGTDDFKTRFGSLSGLATFVEGYSMAKSEAQVSGATVASSAKDKQPTVVVVRGGVVQGVYGEPGTSIELVDLDDLDDLAGMDPVVTVKVEDIALNCAIKGMVAEHVENQRALGLTN